MAIPLARASFGFALVHVGVSFAACTSASLPSAKNRYGRANLPRRIKSELCYLRTVSVTLTRSDVAISLPNQVALPCPRCGKAYTLAYDDTEWNRLSNWLKVGTSALRVDHLRRHELPSLTLKWNPVRGR